MSPRLSPIWQEKHTFLTHADHLHTQEATTQPDHKFDANSVDFIKFIDSSNFIECNKTQKRMVLISELFLIEFDNNTRL